MKKIIATLLLIVITMTMLIPTTSFSENGDIIGYAKYTDISAYINHYPITSYNINDYTVVVAEDLRNYGFNVVWDGNNRALYITKNPFAMDIIPGEKVYKYASVAGQNSHPYVETDIKTFVDGNWVESFNINGETCIYMDSLTPYGEVAWVPEIRAVKLWINGLPMKDFEYLEEAAVTKMYSRDGRTIIVDDSEIEAYKNVGWFPVQASGIDPTKPMVAITYDDGPNPDSTNRILDTLKFYNARATFFVLGSLAEKHPSVLLKMKEIGCQIGNHTYDHPKLTGLSAQNISAQINKASDIVANITGIRPTAVRPPYGSYNSTVSASAGAPLIIWSIDPRDWESRNAEAVISEVVPKVQDGDIVLMHDIYESTATASESIIPALLEKGFQLVTIDELAYYKNKPLTPGTAYSRIR